VSTAHIPEMGRRVELADARDMQRAADHPDQGQRLIRWLARRLGGWVALFDQGGAVLHASPHLSEAAAGGAADTIARVRAGEVASAVTDLGDRIVHVVALGGVPDPVLVAASPRPVPEGAAGLISDAARLVRLRRQVAAAREGSGAVEEAGWRVRMAVIHLLMTGNVESAHRVAGALTPHLPDPLRMHVIEGPAHRRGEIARRCLAEIGSRAWVIKCPVYDDHVIVLAPAGSAAAEHLTQVLDDGQAERVRARLHALVAADAEVRMGESATVPLRGIGTAYEQAIHALAAARHRTERHSVFGPRAALSQVLDPAARTWAARLLEPLLGYRPERRTDPGAQELQATLRSWLDLHSRAARQLNIHRNTVTARLGRIEDLLGCDLGDLAGQARLHLALRLVSETDLGAVPAGERAPELAELLCGTQVRYWAEGQLGPLLEEDGLGLATLRVWLACNARLEDTAYALGISAGGVRKRLIRAEQDLGRSLLSGPSARYPLYFAIRIHDGAP
jgi:sugar diacid utilization regulator